MERKAYTYTVLVEPGEDGYFIASVPALPGCLTEGKSVEEAIDMARDAIRGYLEGLVEDGEPIPEETGPAKAVAVGIRVELPATA